MSTVFKAHRKTAEGIVLFLLSIAISRVALWYGAAGVNLAWYEKYCASWPLLLLNYLPAALLLLLLYFATGRPWIAFVATAALTLALALTNYFKLLLRNDPLLLSDLLLVGEATNMTGRYTLTFDARMILCLAGVLAVAAGLFFLFRGRTTLSGKARALGSLLVAGVFAALLGTVYANDALYARVAEAPAWTPTNAYVSHGMVYPFLHSAFQRGDTPPDGYNADEARALLAARPDADMPEGKKPHILSVMLEAFCDLSEYEQIEIDPSAYAALHALEAESWSGQLITSIFAGGTVDTERCFLTGCFSVPSLRRDTESYVRYLRRQGYRTGGVHPWYSWFYNRVNVNAYLGLERYAFLEDRFADANGDLYTDDQTFFAAVYEDFLSAKAEGAPWFSYNLTYQNHGPYPTEPLYGAPLAPWKEGYTEAEYHILNNYLAGVKDTGERLSALADRLREDPEPVVLIAFGDHKPWLGDQNSVYAMLGIDLDRSTPEGFGNYYGTPFLIWANTAAKRALGFDFVGDAGRLGPYFLLPELFRQSGLEGSALMRQMTALLEQTRYVNAMAYEQNGLPVLRENEPAWLLNAEEAQYYLLHSAAGKP